MTLARVPSLGVSPWGGRCLHSTSGCNSVVRPSVCTCSVQMDLLRSQVLQPFPTPGLGTLWVAGESLRDRRVSCLPQWTVCPTSSPSLGPNRSTCRGEWSWAGPLVTPPGWCHREPLTNGPRHIPPYCLCSGGADTVTGGAPKPLMLRPLPAFSVGPSRPAPLSLCGLSWWVSRLSWVGWGPADGGAAPHHSWPSCLCACPRLPGLWFATGCGGWSPATPGCGSWVWLPATPGWGPLVLVGGGPSPLLAEVRRFALPAVGSGWTFPRHSWLRAPGAVPRHSWLGALWCWLWVAPGHSWLRVLGAVPRHSSLGSAGCGDGRFRGVWWGVSRVACVCGAAGAGVCVVCLWRGSGCGWVFPVCWRVCGVWQFVPLAGACCGRSLGKPGGGSCVRFPPLLAGFRCRWW